jgi:hypothetical protein
MLIPDLSISQDLSTEWDLPEDVTWMVHLDIFAIA